jgi:hypothetical protein
MTEDRFGTLQNQLAELFSGLETDRILAAKPEETQVQAIQQIVGSMFSTERELMIEKLQRKCILLEEQRRAPKKKEAALWMLDEYKREVETLMAKFNRQKEEDEALIKEKEQTNKLQKEQIKMLQSRIKSLEAKIENTEK